LVTHAALCVPVRTVAVQSEAPMATSAVDDPGRSAPPGAAPSDQRRESAAGSPGLWWVLGLSVAAVVASTIQIIFHLVDRGCFLLTLCFLVCAVAAWTDVATRRIPNVLTYPAILIGLGFNALLPPLLEWTSADIAIIWIGTTGFRDGILGFGLCALIGIISFIARGIGGGDTKLLAAVGAMLGLAAVTPVLFNTLLIAAAIGLLNWAMNGTLVPRMQVIAGNLLITFVTKRGLKDVYPFGRTEAPFGLSLLLGLASAQFIAIHEILLNYLL